ncbi:MAG: hypothetical protein ABSH51_19555 [Solirubrobacteraceae bacterium]|jgi:hypothetical protein
MNPLLFADWGRINRMFTRTMWLVAVILVLACGVALAGPGRPSRPRAGEPRPAAFAPVSVSGAARRHGAPRVTAR